MLRYSMLAPGDRVVAAVSGGADSVCLFSVLRELSVRLGVTVAGVAHLNHKLRGDASDEDERFVAALAARCGVPFFREEASAEMAGGNLEQSARRERLQFFSRLIREDKANRIATGHTRDDQAETVLFRLLRGSGLAGLAGILPVTREGLIRPLLNVSRAEVEEFLGARAMSWREDGSNLDRRFSRNRIRHDLLPQLAREWNPEIAGALGHLAELAAEEERWWHGKIVRLAGKLLVASEGGCEVLAEDLARLPKSVARRLVRHAVGGAEFDQVERVLDLTKKARGSGALQLPGMLVERSFDRLRFKLEGREPEPEPVSVEVPGRYRWMDCYLCFEVAEKPKRAGCVRLKWKGRHRAARLELRGWRAGDHYRPWGRSRDQKIQEMFQKARIPSWKRSFWPILTNGSKILWVREFGAAAEFAWEAGAGASLWIWEEKNGEA
jgi:tRNA(Ile)-lysidine synthase